MNWVEFTNAYTTRPVHVRPEKVVSIMSIEDEMTEIGFEGGGKVIVSMPVADVTTRLGIVPKATTPNKEFKKA
jgi:hypothetical protein